MTMMETKQKLAIELQDNKGITLIYCPCNASTAFVVSDSPIEDITAVIKSLGFGIKEIESGIFATAKIIYNGYWITLKEAHDVS